MTTNTTTTRMAAHARRKNKGIKLIIRDNRVGSINDKIGASYLSLRSPTET